MADDKRRRFVDEYLLDLNATQAAIRAGYSPRSARVTSTRLLANANIQAAIQARQAERAQRTASDADKILAEYRHIAFTDLRDVFQTVAGGLRVRPISEWPESVGRALAGIKVKQSLQEKPDGTFEPMEVIEFRLHPKVPALHDLAMHEGYGPSIPRDHVLTLFVAVAESVKRHVNDERILTAITMDLNSLVGRKVVIDAHEVGSPVPDGRVVPVGGGRQDDAAAQQVVHPAGKLENGQGAAAPVLATTERGT